MTDIYPAFFSATALLKPKNAPPEALFQIGDPALRNGYRKLYPKPEDVKAAIAAFKQAGMTARFGLSHALDVSGPTEALREVFGIGVEGFAASSGEITFHLVDKDKKVVEIAKPSDGHPIGTWVEALYVQAPAGQFNNQPRHPHAQGDQVRKWGKKELFHVWPHELRYRLDAAGHPVERKLAVINDNGWKTEKGARDVPLGRNQTVNIVDSGIESAHSYFDDLGLDAFTGGSRNGLTIAPPFDHAKRPLQAAHATRDQLDDLAKTLKRFAEKIKNGQFLGPSGYTIPTETMTTLKKDLDSLRGQTYFAYTLNGYKRTIDGKDFEEFQQVLGVIDSGGNFFKGNPPLWPINKFHEYVIAWKNAAQRTVQALVNYGRANVDPDGHGTRMAASALGVARLARIRVHTAMVNFDTQTHGWAVGNTHEYVRFALEQAIEEAIRSGKPQIISNSWGTIHELAALDPISDALKADLARLVPLVKKALKHNHVLIFSAGNARHPDMSRFSLEATAGFLGAIVVGGAWDENETVNHRRNPVVRLSNAAHGFWLKIPVIDENGVTTYQTTAIPTTCALVGPEVAFDSTYVYTPTRGNTWDYNGAGTSSAAAQVAGLCACLREKFGRDMTVGDIVASIRGGGTAIEKSTALAESVSFQGNSVEAIDPFLTRVSIAGAMREAAKRRKSGST